jgi:hypothetical protein
MGGLGILFSEWETGELFLHRTSVIFFLPINSFVTNKLSVAVERLPYNVTLYFSRKEKLFCSFFFNTHGLTGRIDLII